MKKPMNKHILTKFKCFGRISEKNTLWILPFQCWLLVEWVGRSRTGNILRIIYLHQVTPIKRLKIYGEIVPTLNAYLYINVPQRCPIHWLFYSKNVFRKHSEHRCLFQLTSVFEGATESDISLRICNRKEPAVVGTLKHTHTYLYVCAVITRLFFKSDNYRKVKVMSQN